jgi:hypothetical protein
MEIAIQQKFSKKYYCKYCDYYTSRKSNIDSHNLSAKHLIKVNGNQNQQKFSNQISNKICDEYSSIHNELVNEYLTPLNQLEINGNKIQQKISNNYSCKICEKTYKTASGLWKHNQTCKKQETIINEIELLDSKLIFELLKQNNEFKELILNQSNQMLEQNKSMMELFKNNNITTTNNIVNGNVNTQNTHFNIQMFLNDTCKDAMTIQDFVESLKPTLHDLEETGRLGYSEGISRIIINGLKELDVTKRPIHCSDLKRETMFIKNTESWEKETEEKPILLKAIKDIGKKNIMNIKEWQKNNTHFNHYDSKQNDAYLQIVSNSMSGGTIEEQQSNYEKIVRNIAKETIINKK